MAGKNRSDKINAIHIPPDGTIALTNKNKTGSRPLSWLLLVQSYAGTSAKKRHIIWQPWINRHKKDKHFKSGNECALK